MAKTKYEENPRIIIELSKDEAIWIKDMARNYLGPPNTESHHDSQIREAIYISLDEVI